MRLIKYLWYVYSLLKGHMVCTAYYSTTVVKLTNHNFPSLGWKITIGSLSTSALAALKIWLTTSLEHRLESSLDGTSGEISYVFLLCFTVLLKRLRRLYTGSFIFQVPPVSDYSTCVRTRIYAFGAPVSCLRVRCTNHLLTRSVHQPPIYKALTNQGEAHQYIDYVVCFNIKDSHHRLKEHTIPYIFRAPRHDSLMLLN